MLEAAASAACRSPVTNPSHVLILTNSAWSTNGFKWQMLRLPSAQVAIQLPKMNYFNWKISEN